MESPMTTTDASIRRRERVATAAAAAVAVVGVVGCGGEPGAVASTSTFQSQPLDVVHIDDAEQVVVLPPAIPDGPPADRCDALEALASPRIATYRSALDDERTADTADAALELEFDAVRSTWLFDLEPAIDVVEAAWRGRDDSIDTAAAVDAINEVLRSDCASDAQLHAAGS